MKFGWPKTILAKILLVALPPILLLALILSTYVVNARLGDLNQAFEDRGKAVARQMASAALLGLFTGDRQMLRTSSQRQLSQDLDIVEIQVLDESGQTVAAATREAIDAASDRLVAFDALVQPPAFSFGGAEEQMTANPIGRVVVQFSERAASRQAGKIIRNAVLITLAAVLVTLLITIVVARQIVRPLVRLREAVQKIAEGDFTVRLHQRALGEIGELEAGVNKMADAIAISADEMQHEVAQATADLHQTMDALEVRNIELDLARKRALQASAAKSEFLANMSHEIRTPMNGVLGFAGLLRKSALDANQQAYVDTIVESGNVLLTNLNEILDFSKMEAGKLKLEVNAFSLRESVDGVARLFSAQAEEKGLVLTSCVDPLVPDGLLGDAVRLRQILNNLVSNAVKFTATGEVSLHVDCATKEASTVWLMFTVSDSGLGIPEDAVSQLFEPFSQGALSTTRIYGGTGLGLNICQRLSSAMGGSIDVQSRPGVGSDFTVRLPFRRAAQTADSPNPLETDGQAAAVMRRDWLANLVFLVADDNPINLQLVEALLVGQGADVVSATDGKDARALALSTAIDMAFIDIHMPEMNGVELVEQIHSAKPDLPVVALTADVTMLEKLAPGEQAFFACLTKPFDASAFYQVIAEALGIDGANPASAAVDTADEDPAQARDRVKAIHRAAGSEVAADALFERFLKTLPEALIQMDAAYLTQDWDALWQATHRLQGAAAICSLPALNEALAELATTVRNAKLERIANALALVRHEADRLLTEAS